MLKRMKMNCPTTVDWNLSNMNDLHKYLPQLSQLPLTRELNSLIFEIREAGNMIATFQQSISSNKDIVLDKKQASPFLQPNPSITPSGSSVAVHLPPVDARFIHETWHFVNKVYICIVGTAHTSNCPRLNI